MLSEALSAMPEIWTTPCVLEDRVHNDFAFVRLLVRPNESPSLGQTISTSFGGCLPDESGTETCNHLEAVGL